MEARVARTVKVPGADHPITIAPQAARVVVYRWRRHRGWSHPANALLRGPSRRQRPGQLLLDRPAHLVDRAPNPKRVTWKASSSR
jgi:hypothetical protein